MDGRQWCGGNKLRPRAHQGRSLSWRDGQGRRRSESERIYCIYRIYHLGFGRRTLPHRLMPSVAAKQSATTTPHER